MFRMTSEVTIDKFTKVPISSIKWENSMTVYRNSATIVTSNKFRLNGYIDTTGILKKGFAPAQYIFQVGMKVSIKCGYDGENDLRFAGFITSLSVQDYQLVIGCEGYSYQLRNKGFTKSYYNSSLKQILKDLIEGTDIILSDKIADTKFTGNIIFGSGKTGVDALQYMMEKLHLTVYFNHNILYVGLRYTLYGKDVKFRMDWNVIKSNSLLFSKNQTQIKVVCVSRKPDGSRLIVTSGNGTELRISTDRIIDEDELKKLADDLNKRKNEGSHKGDFTAFLKPLVCPADTAIIYNSAQKDDYYSYFVETVKGSISDKGGRQIVEIGLQLNKHNISQKQLFTSIQMPNNFV